MQMYKVADQKAKEWFKPSKLEEEAAKPSESNEFGWQNRRVSSEEYQWFPNSKDMLAAVGGDLFLVHPNGKHEQLTKTEIDEEDPKLSPDGEKILYRSKSNLYLLDLPARKVRQLTTDGTATLLNGQLDWVYPEELDLSTAAWWSPDSKQIAFMQFDVSHEFVYPQSDLLGERAVAEPERYPQAGTANALVRIGIITVETGAIKWLDLGETSNSLFARVIWLPDGSQVAVERLNRVQDKLDVLLCDPATGAAHNVLHQESKTWINFTDNLYFLKSRPEFIWTSEADGGFRHIYRYSDKGELLGQLTKGDWEVKTIAAINEAQQKVYFTSSETSPLESQLYVVPLSGGARTRLTPETGVHYIHGNAAGTYFLDSFSNAKQPSSQLLRDTDGATVAILREPDLTPLQQFDILPSEIVEVKSDDGSTLYGRLTMPAGYQAGLKYPLIVEVYGGPGVQTVRNEWEGVSWAQVMAHRGYLIWQMDNHGSSGRGHQFEEPIYREMGTREVADQRLGVEYLVKQGLADPARVGITGWSYGGYMTIHALLLAPDVFKAGVAGAPVTDWHNYDTIYTERYMDQPQNNLNHYNVSSNVQNAANLQGKLLIVHNIEDDNVLFQNTLQMASALEKSGKLFFMQIYPQKRMEFLAHTARG